MMPLLIRNVILNLFDVRCAHGKYAVSGLPREIRNSPALSFNPERGCAFQLAHKLRLCDLASEAHEEMHVVGGAADKNRLTLMAGGNTGKVGVEGCPQFRVLQKPRAFLRGKHDMSIHHGKRLRHGE